MARACREATRALGRVHPNPPVGVVIVRDGRLVGRGHTQAPPGPHAEVMALHEAAGAARGATLYATLEPCNHQGRTPPCTSAILEAGIRRVVCAARDPNTVAAGGLERLASAGVAVEDGVSGRLAGALLTPFLHWARTGRPYVVLKSAVTLDGKTASRTGASRWITGPVARSYVHRLRSRLGAVMVGIGTVLADDPLLNVRPTYSARTPRSQPTRIVLDSRLRLPIDSRLVRSAEEVPLIVVCRTDADEQQAGALRALGADVLAVPERGGKPDFAILMADLGARGVTGVLLEGGGDVAFSALQAGCVDEVVTFIAPKLLGGREAPTAIGGPGFETPGEAVPVRGLSVRRCGVDWVLRGWPESGLSREIQG